MDDIRLQERKDIGNTVQYDAYDEWIGDNLAIVSITEGSKKLKGTIVILEPDFQSEAIKRIGKYIAELLYEKVERKPIEIYIYHNGEVQFTVSK